MQEITLKLTREEVAAIVSVLGELPTKTGAYPLTLKIQQQIEDQTKDQE